MLLLKMTFSSLSISFLVYGLQLIIGFWFVYLDKGLEIHCYEWKKVLGICIALLKLHFLVTTLQRNLSKLAKTKVSSFYLLPGLLAGLATRNRPAYAFCIARKIQVVCSSQGRVLWKSYLWVLKNRDWSFSKRKMTKLRIINLREKEKCLRDKIRVK